MFFTELSCPFGQTITVTYTSGKLTSVTNGLGQVHYGLAESCKAHRQKILNKAFQRHPERFVRGQPQPMPLRSEAWINPPPEPTPKALHSDTNYSGAIIGRAR